MKTVKASEFKAKCLQMMDQVAETGESIVITKRGLPVAELVSARPKPGKIFGAMRGRMKTLGDIVSPVDAEWEAMR